ncbi:MAG TPA: hypothetical protein VFD92_26935 [Candidatus Binatia bacterium]|nr:hypothetical protein [Candidatus Binatia bacterium]
MLEDGYVAIPNVSVVADGLALVCEVDGKRVGVPRTALHPHSEVRKVGDRGSLTIIAWVARDLGIEPPR